MLRSWILVEILKLGLVKILNFELSGDGWVFSWCLVEILKMKCDQDLCLNLWYDLKKLLCQDELNPRVRCFDIICSFSCPAKLAHMAILRIPRVIKFVFCAARYCVSYSYSWWRWLYVVAAILKNRMKIFLLLFIFLSPLSAGDL